MNKNFLLNALTHIVAVLLFIGISSLYFSPLFKGYELNQGDIVQFTGMSKEIADYRLVHGSEPLWTNSMFGGMPAYQISVIHSSNWLLAIDKVLKLGLPAPVGVLFMAMLGFYILCLCVRINPWLGLLGAVAFGLASINILYLGAGHNGKVNAIAYMAPALGGLLLAYRHNRWLGLAVFILFFGLQVSANHLQMTYYLVWLLGAVAVAEIAWAVWRKQTMKAVLVSLLLAAGGVLAILPSASNLLTTYEYGKYTTRGTTELTITPDGEEKDASEVTGLETSYILDYNLGKGEVWSLMIPNAKGGQSGYLGNEKEAMKKVTGEMKENVSQRNRYWGEQRFTGGAFYFGAATMLLFLFGLFFCSDKLRWPFALLTLLALSLSLKDVTGLNSFFINHVPLYNKFRDSKMILTMVQVMAPLMAMLALQQLYTQREKLHKRKFIIFSGVVALIFIAMLAAPKTFFTFQSSDERAQLDEYMQQVKAGSEQEQMVLDFVEQLENARLTLFTADVQRTLFIVLLVLAVLLVYRLGKLPFAAMVPVLLIVVLLDQWMVVQRYLNLEKARSRDESNPRMEYVHYVKREKKLLPHTPGLADTFILEAERKEAKGMDEVKDKLLNAMKNSSRFRDVKNDELLEQVADFGALGLTTDFRVLKLGDPFNDAGTSYFHKSLGGYHGAKLKRYQELISFHIQPEMKRMVDSLQQNRPDVFASLPVLNMLNMKYILYNPERPPIMNTLACGNAWFVREVKLAANADEEITMLGSLDTHTQAVADQRFETGLVTNALLDSTATIKLEQYGTNYLKYRSSSNTEATAVFSEIYYPEGWQCSVDGTPVDYVRINYALRGLKVPAGEHTIEWQFAPTSFRKGSTLSLAGSVLLLLVCAGALFVNWRSERAVQHSAQ